MNWYLLDDFICARMEELRKDWIRANAKTPGTGHSRRHSLSDAVCRWRTRVGAAVMGLGRLIVPASARAGMAAPAGKLDHC